MPTICIVYSREMKILELKTKIQEEQKLRQQLIDVLMSSKKDDDINKIRSKVKDALNVN